MVGINNPGVILTDTLRPVLHEAWYVSETGAKYSVLYHLN